MKNFILLLLTILFANVSCHKSHDSSNADWVWGAASHGNAAIITGYFQGTANFDGLQLVADGWSDIFVAKWE